MLLSESHSMRSRSSQCKRAITGMLVEKIDRLYRYLKDWVTVDELDLQMHFPKEVWCDRASRVLRKNSRTACLTDLLMDRVTLSRGVMYCVAANQFYPDRVGYASLQRWRGKSALFNSLGAII